MLVRMQGPPSALSHTRSKGPDGVSVASTNATLASVLGGVAGEPHGSSCIWVPVESSEVSVSPWVSSVAVITPGPVMLVSAAVPVLVASVPACCVVPPALASLVLWPPTVSDPQADSPQSAHSTVHTGT